ncbi:hypothetical protein NKR19_g2187 [Coniochaeta hoffmannii]|uniref:P-loop containing nucleoside triphosphate hydrolase protein n=1 Tax=Coniochaeta hoffmannii TaxID=91930 RepID=A0AA38SB21_9PEZI|nr:hypothetical protein NKR19_g2187 [Coniochaeta hoffmannii]
MASKTLAVFGQGGAGKKTLVGSLLYKCEGITMDVLRHLEGSTDRKYESVVPFFEQRGLAMSFYAPSGKIEVDNSTTTPDIAIWLADVANADRGAASSSELASRISNGSLKPKEKLLILLNKMDQVDWSEAAFKEAAAHFRSNNPGSTVTYIIPISASHGDNFFELADYPWLRDGSVTPVLHAFG